MPRIAATLAMSVIAALMAGCAPPLINGVVTAKFIQTHQSTARTGACPEAGPGQESAPCEVDPVAGPKSITYQIVVQGADRSGRSRQARLSTDKKTFAATQVGDRYACQSNGSHCMFLPNH